MQQKKRRKKKKGFIPPPNDDLHATELPRCASSLEEQSHSPMWFFLFLLLFFLQTSLNLCKQDYRGTNTHVNHGCQDSSFSSFHISCSTLLSASLLAARERRGEGGGGMWSHDTSWCMCSVKKGGEKKPQTGAKILGLPGGFLFFPSSNVCPPADRCVMPRGENIGFSH